MWIKSVLPHLASSWPAGQSFTPSHHCDFHTQFPSPQCNPWIQDEESGRAEETQEGPQHVLYISMCVCVCKAVFTAGLYGAVFLTIITQEDSSHQQEEQQGDHCSHSVLHTPLLYVWHTSALKNTTFEPLYITEWNTRHLIDFKIRLCSPQDFNFILNWCHLYL